MVLLTPAMMPIQRARTRVAAGLIAGAVLLALAVSCQARAESIQVQIKVRWFAHDTDTPDNARRLLLRIESAAYEACGGSTFSLPDYRAAVLASACWGNIVVTAVREIDASMLTAVASKDPRISRVIQ